MALPEHDVRLGGGIRGANLAARFLLELAMLAALAYWGFTVGGNLGIKLVLGLGAPLVAIVAWGTLVAPKRKIRLPDPARLSVEVVLFGLAVWGLVAADARGWAIALAAAAALNIAALFALRQR